MGNVNTDFWFCEDCVLQVDESNETCPSCGKSKE